MRGVKMARQTALLRWSGRVA